MTNTTDIWYDEPKADQIVVALIGVMGIILNTVTLIVMLNNFTRIFSNAEACFVSNLCTADLFTNIAALLWALFPFSQYPIGLTLAIYCILWATVSASFLTLSCMAIERLLVVVNPIKTQRMLKKPFAYISCAVVWFVSIVTGSMVAVNSLIAQSVMVIMFEISLIVTIGCYIRIYFTVKKLRREGTKIAARYSAKNAKLKIEMEENEPALHQRVAVRQESRITNLVFVLILVLAVTVLPYMVLLQVVLAHMLACPGCERSSAMTIALDVLFPLEMLNFILNPAVYAWRLPKFRQASKRTLNQFICCDKLRTNTDALAGGNYSYSSSSDSLTQGPATIFTGEDTSAQVLNNNNRHS